MKSAIYIFTLLVSLLAFCSFKQTDNSKTKYCIKIGTQCYKYGSKISKDELLRTREFVYADETGKKVFVVANFEWVLQTPNASETWKANIKTGAGMSADLLNFRNSIKDKAGSGFKLYFDEIANLPKDADYPKQFLLILQ